MDKEIALKWSKRVEKATYFASGGLFFSSALFLLFVVSIA